jgi:hypothetical protein
MLSVQSAFTKKSPSRIELKKYLVQIAFNQAKTGNKGFALRTPNGKVEYFFADKDGDARDKWIDGFSRLFSLFIFALLTLPVSYPSILDEYWWTSSIRRS